MAPLRYVDDTGLASRTVCQHCLCQVLHATYTGVVDFETDEKYYRVSAGCVSNKFLDMIITITFDDIQFSLFLPNLQFFKDGCVDSLSKIRFPPAVGRTDEITRRLGVNLASRRARWKQLKLPKPECAKAFLLDILELWMLGYSYVDVRRALYAVRFQDLFVHLCLDIVVMLKPLWPTRRQLD